MRLTFLSSADTLFIAHKGVRGVYLDVLWILNFVVDLLLLIASNRLAGHQTAVGRCVLAAALGGFYGSVCVLPGWIFLARTLWRLVILSLMGAIAFGLNKNSFRRCILFVFLSMALGGIALNLGKGGFFSVLFCASLVCVMCFFGLRGKLGNRYLPVEIRCDKQCHRFTAMIDTGNTLTDPITGQQVLVVSSAIGHKLLGQCSVNFADPVSIVECIRGAQLIPYHAVGIEGGLLAAKRFQDVTIGKWHGSCLIAFAPGELGRGESYEALTGGII